MNSEIILDGVSLRFRIYRNPTPSFKDAILRMVRPSSASEVMEFSALDNLSLRIASGDRLGIVGLNGAGKSTLLKMVAGIYFPHRGKVTVRGRVTPLMELGAGFDAEQSGLDNILLNGTLLGYTPAYLRGKIPEIESFSELGDFITMPVKYYSSGMFMRLAFSVATMTAPEILLVDEILSVGDKHFVGKAMDRLKRLIDVSQIVLLVSHDLDQVRELCNRIVVLHHGKMVYDGEVDGGLARYEELVAGEDTGGTGEPSTPGKTEIPPAS